MNMIKIALCDDNKQDLLKLKMLLEECCELFQGEPLNIDCHLNGDSLISAIKAGEFYDLIFLDIVMPGMLGTKIAQQIYESNKVTQFIFLTSSPEFAIESYSVEALDYILKPTNKARIEQSLLRYRRKSQIQEIDEIIVRDKNGLVRIPLHTLCYVESIDHLLIYHLFDGQEISCRQNLFEAEKQLLKKNNFVKPNRSYLVNMDYIVRIDSGCITMKNGDTIYASRSNVKELPNLFLKYKFVNGKGGSFNEHRTS